MNRRNFLKFLGMGAAGSTLPAIPKTKTIRDQVSEHVIYPEDIVKDPNPSNFNRLDLNDDISGMAGYFTARLCQEWLEIKENRTMENLKALLKFSMTQSSFVGLIVAKNCCNAVIKMPQPEKMVAIEIKEFQDVVKHFGDLLFMVPAKEYSRYSYKLKDNKAYYEYLRHIKRA
jgi:hypothetical protein